MYRNDGKGKGPSASSCRGKRRNNPPLHVTSCSSPQRQMPSAPSHSPTMTGGDGTHHPSQNGVLRYAQYQWPLQEPNLEVPSITLGMPSKGYVRGYNPYITSKIYAFDKGTDITSILGSWNSHCQAETSDGVCGSVAWAPCPPGMVSVTLAVQMKSTLDKSKGTSWATRVSGDFEVEMLGKNSELLGRWR